MKGQIPQGMTQFMVISVTYYPKYCCAITSYLEWKFLLSKAINNG